MALLPYPRYRHAYEPGCAAGALTELLTGRCDHVTATDVTTAALDAAHRRLLAAHRRRQVTLLQQSLDSPWPPARFDLVVLSEVCYHLQPETLRAVLDRQVPQMVHGGTVIAAHWRHRVEGVPMSGDHANDIVAATPGLHHIGGYGDADIVVDVFDTGSAASVAARSGVPGA